MGDPKFGQLDGVDNQERVVEEETEIVDPKRQAKRERMAEYNRLRKGRFDFARKFASDADRDEKEDIEWYRNYTESEVKDATRDVPLDSEYRRQLFYRKRLWDNFVEPILEYDNLVREIESSDMSNTKKKVALNALKQRKQGSELPLFGLEDWPEDAPVQEKKKYLEGIEKFILERN